MFKIHRPIVVDWETYYDQHCSVKANKKTGWVGGPWHYTHHKDFYAYMVSWLDLDTNERGVIDDPTKFAPFLDSIRGRTMVAHNAGFDYAVCKWALSDWEPLNTFDTADMASYLQSGRSLLEATKTLLGRDIDKSARDYMTGKHYRDLPAADKKMMVDYALSDAVNEADLFRKYSHMWPEIEQWMSDYTRKQNWAGVHIDTNYLEGEVDKVGALRSAAVAKIPWVENIDTDKPLSAKKLAEYCREVKIDAPASLAEDSEECQEWEHKYGDTHPVVGAIRDFRKANTLYKKLDLINRLIRPDGTIPFATKYAAAPHTLRFSATQFNYQSMPRDADICDLRGCLVPPPGHKFISSDLSGIEARCLPWLAGDTDYLAEVKRLDDMARDARTGESGDLYEPAARRMFGYADPRPLKKVDKDLRNATKVCVLQLGYQSGAKKFLHYLNNNVEPEVLNRVRQGGEDDAALALRLVQLYRGMNPKVQNLWYSLDRSLRDACATGGTFQVQQPIGRVVNYYNLGVRVSVKEGKVRNEIVGSVLAGESEQKNLYGGKITENICQEMARHVFVRTIYNLSQAGFQTNFSVHDENVVALPDNQATPEARLEIERIMSNTPEWAPGLPLAAETGILKRYAK